MEEEKVTIEDIKSLEISKTTKEDLSVRSLSNTPSAHSSQYGQKGLTAAEIRAKYSALPEHIVDNFNKLIKALSNLIPAIEARGVKSLSFTDDGKIAITLNNGDKLTTDASWLADVSNGGNVPPTAEAVKNYAVKRRKVTDNGHYVYTETNEGTVVYPVAQAPIVGKPNIPLRDKNGHLKAADPTSEEHLTTKKYVDENTIGSVEFNDKNFTITFKKPNGETLKIIDLPTESLVSTVKFDENTKKVIITLQNGGVTEIPATDIFNPAWVEDISIGGNMPPTADAVKDYAVKRRQITDKGHYVYTETNEGTLVYPVSQAVTPGKRSIALRDPSGNLQASDPTSEEHLATKKYVDSKTTFSTDWAGKNVVVGDDGSLAAVDAYPYRHNINIQKRDGSDLIVDVYVVVYTHSPEPMMWGEIQSELYSQTLMGDYPCQGTINHNKATSLRYSEVPNDEGAYDSYLYINYVLANGSAGVQVFNYEDLTYDDRVAEYDIGEIKNAISENKSDIKDITRRVDNLEDVLVEEKIVESTEYVTPVPSDVGKNALLCEVGGMTYKSKNLANIYGFSAVVGFAEGAVLKNPCGTEISTSNPDNSITVTQNSYSSDYGVTDYHNGYFCIGVDTNLQEGEEYTFSCDVKITEDLTNGNSAMAILPNSLWDTTVNVSNGRFVANGYWHLGNKASHINIRNGGKSAIFSNFMLERGHTDGTYTPYYDGLRNAKVTAIESRGKNHIDMSASFGKTVTANGGTLTCGNDGGVSGSGTPTGYVALDNLATVTLTPNTEYTFSVSGSYSNMIGTLTLKDADNNTIGSSFNLGSGTKKAITIDTSDYVGVTKATVAVKRSSDNVALSGTMYMQLEIGETATEYAPYRKPITYTLPEAITSREEYGLGIVLNNKVYSNTIDFENKKYYPNRAKKIVFDGSEEWMMENFSLGINFYTAEVIEGAIKDTSVLCNHYNSKRNDGETRNIVFISNSGRFNAPVDGFSSFEEWKAKLAEWAANGNPLTVVCGFDDDTYEDIYIDEYGDVIEVEPGGSLVAVNEHGLDALTKVSYIVAKGGNAE